MLKNTCIYHISLKKLNNEGNSHVKKYMYLSYLTLKIK